MGLKIEKLIEDGEVIFLAYLGFITQPLITSMIDALETIDENDESIDFPQKLFVIFIEMAQNIMHYALKDDYKSFILIGKDKDSGDYYILSKNSVNKEGRKRVEESLNEIKGLDKKAIRALYKERRRSGKGVHEKGGGIGFLEIAKLSKRIDFDFEDFKDDKYIFAFKVYV